MPRSKPVEEKYLVIAFLPNGKRYLKVVGITCVPIIQDLLTQLGIEEVTIEPISIQ